MTSFCHHVIPKINQIISRHLKKIDSCIWQVKKHNFHFNFQWLDEIFICSSTKNKSYNNILHEVGKNCQFCSNNELQIYQRNHHELFGFIILTIEIASPFDFIGQSTKIIPPQNKVMENPKNQCFLFNFVVSKA